MVNPINFDTKVESERHPCPACKKLHAVKVFRVEAVGLSIGDRQLCVRCREVITKAEASKLSEAKKKELGEKWAVICPPLYIATELSRLQITDEIKAEVLAWKPGEVGIALAGASGTGKTRLMFKLLERLHFEGLRVMAVSAKTFERACGRMFDKDISSRELIEKCERVPILFMDDLGKEKFTERVESELYSLIEIRTGNLLPLLWTTNSTSKGLSKMLSEDRGAPIIRRLREFSNIITV